MCGVMGDYVCGKPVATRHTARSIDDHGLDIPTDGARKNGAIRSLLAQIPKPGNVTTGTLRADVQLAAGALKLMG
jgi:hypothetical protein